jgi:hypothetical protein
VTKLQADKLTAGDPVPAETAAGVVALAPLAAPFAA